MKNISIDIETYSSINLGKSGVYKYAESDDFQILLLSYSIDYKEVHVVDLDSGEKIPKEVLNALENEEIKKWAFNANFERVCLSKYLKKYLNPKNWRCTMILGATLGLPMSLEHVGQILNLPQQKLKEGKSLIKYFSCPNKYNQRNLPTYNKSKWQNFKNYNKVDVVVEMDIQKVLSKYPLDESEWENYEIDQLINDKGIMIDKDFVKAAITCDEKYKKNIFKRVKNLTKIENPNSVYQMKNWLENQGVFLSSLNKDSLKEIPENTKDKVKEVLTLRQELSKSSVKKYQVMENVMGKDQRARGLIQFYGANKTGRFAGRLIQVQNLPKNYLSDLPLARDLVKSGYGDSLKFLYDSVENVLSQLIRTAFVPREGCKFIVADFSAIEARVLSWLAGEKWRMEVFERGGDIYCESASKMFKVKVEKKGENSHLRQKGKIAELALGYGGSVGALKAMGATNMGISEEELKSLVSYWRNANPHITKLWYEVHRAIKTVIFNKTSLTLNNLRIFYENNMLFIVLPSKRKICYKNPQIIDGNTIVYEGITASKKWGKIESYGAKFVENIVQGISRDLLCETMKNLTKANLPIVLHVHDEVVVEVEKDRTSLEEVCNLMSKVPPWAKNLVLNAEGYECEFYMKK
ncbi:DNA polymerase [Terrisporobacter sp.]